MVQDESPTATHDDLAATVGLVAAGDACALRVLFDATSPRLFAMVRRIVGEPTMAEDVLQEAYIKVWQQAAGYDATRGDVTAWLTIIARHCAIDARRRLRRVQRNVTAVEVAALPGHVAADTVGAVAVRTCLGRLAAAQRQAIVLAYYHGMSHEEISACLGIPLGTAKSHLRRGLKALQRCVGDDG